MATRATRPIKPAAAVARGAPPAEAEVEELWKPALEAELVEREVAVPEVVMVPEVEPVLEVPVVMPVVAVPVVEPVVPVVIVPEAGPVVAVPEEEAVVVATVTLESMTN